MTSVLLADDHLVLLEGIKGLIEKEEDIEVVDFATHGEEVLVKVGKWSPDLVLLDINMPGKNGMEICGKILQISPSSRILVMSMHSDAYHVQNMLKKGAHGYITKGVAPQEMLKAIRKVASGKSYFNDEATRAVMEGLVSGNKQEEKFELKLSRREKEILKLIVEERTSQEIADELFISLKTVETHRRNLLSKLNARNTAGLVRIAMERKLI
ncbi:MAG: response regulator transcription factor [Bacteroidota bacterium]